MLQIMQKQVRTLKRVHAIGLADRTVSLVRHVVNVRAVVEFIPSICVRPEFLILVRTASVGDDDVVRLWLLLLLLGL